MAYSFQESPALSYNSQNQRQNCSANRLMSAEHMPPKHSPSHCRMISYTISHRLSRWFRKYSQAVAIAYCACFRIACACTAANVQNVCRTASVIFAAEAVKYEAAIDAATANDRIYEIIFFINSFTSEDIGNTSTRHAYV